jgi:hypothetical protein
VAPDGDRVDLSLPAFSDPTNVTNPLFPISELRSAVLNGRIDGKPFHTETTLLPSTRVIEWSPGHQVETLVSQYVAFLDGRIQEVALDYYAQADDGSVWYFGEDVDDYDPRGVIAYTTDSWLAGQDGPPAMIMPGEPNVGQVFRTENIPSLVFEEVTVKTVDDTVPGPSGPVAGAMVGQELHDDGATSDKVFAPGYGEFLTRDTDGVEAMALAVPTDVLSGPMPAELEMLAGAAERAAAARTLTAVIAARRALMRSGVVPPRLRPPIDRAVRRLSTAVHRRDRIGAADAGIDLAQAALDVELRYRAIPEIDLARFGLWVRQITVDATAHDVAGVVGDVATLEWTRDRFQDRLDAIDRTRIDAAVVGLREDVIDRDLPAARRDADRLGQVLDGIQISG